MPFALLLQNSDRRESEDARRVCMGVRVSVSLEYKPLHRGTSGSR